MGRGLVTPGQWDLGNMCGFGGVGARPSSATAAAAAIGLGAARNIAPLPVYLICRGIVALSRALQEIIVAILLVAIFGFGPLAGFLTLSFASRVLL